MLPGEGVHPTDACNFARFCSSLDFFSITDHAEGMTKQMWDDSIKSIRNCDAVSNDTNEDLVVLQVGNGLKWVLIQVILWA